MDLFKIKKKLYSGLAVLDSRENPYIEELLHEVVDSSYFEARQHERRPSSISLRYQLKSPSSWGVRHREGEAPVLNVSKTGFKIQVADELPIGGKIHLSLTQGDKEFYVDGVVVWSRAVSDPPKAGAVSETSLRTDACIGRYESGIKISEVTAHTIGGPYQVMADYDHPAINQRRAVRKTLEVPVHYRVGRSEEWSDCRSLDFSAYGIRLELSRLISLDDEIEVELNMPADQSRTRGAAPLRFHGKAAWLRPSTLEAGHYQCGVAFKVKDRIRNRAELFAFAAERFCRHISLDWPEWECKAADTFEELKAAYALVYRDGVRRRTLSPNSEKMFYTYHYLFPSARMFVLKRNGQVVGTVSLALDSKGGLPSEADFADELKPMRQAGRRLAEAGLLALDIPTVRAHTPKFMEFTAIPALFRLFKLLFDYARLEAGVTDIFIAADPRHRMVYEYLTFEAVGSEKRLGKPLHALLPMRLDIPRTMDHIPVEGSGKNYYFLQTAVPKSAWQTKLAWTAAKLTEFLRPDFIGRTLSAKDHEFLMEGLR